jgi:NADP-dependent 3-hydroxy acid dehydrogenase YdfG
MTAEERYEQIVNSLTEEEKAIFTSISIACSIAMPDDAGFIATLHAVEALAKTMRMVVDEDAGEEHF